MALGINKTEQLIKQVSPFSSQKVNGLRMINERYFAKSKGISYNPDIETQKIVLNNKTISEFSTKQFPNGDKFEVYRTPEGTIKALKNRFGEIKKFSNSNSSSVEKPEIVLENIKDFFTKKIIEFLD